MQTKLKPLVVALAFALSANSHAVRAADEKASDGNQTPQTLDPIVVSATRTEERLSQVPASVSVVTKDDFDEQQAATVNDVMKDLPNVNFGGSPRVDGQIPTIRGYQGTSITLLIDGARQNSDPAATLASPLYIDPYFLNKAEVARGASSSLYGPGGNGGAMVFTTLSAKDLLQAGQSVGGGVQAGHQTGDQSNHYNARVYGQKDQLDALLAVGYQDFGTIRQGGGTEMLFNGGQSNSSLLKLGLQANDKLRFELSNITYAEADFENNNPQANTTGTQQLLHTNQIQTVLKATTTNDDGEKALEARIYHVSLTNEADANLAINQTYSNTVTETLGASIQNSTRISSDSLGHQRLTYGLEAYKDQMNTLQGNPPTANTGFMPDGKSQVAGAFLEDEIAVGSAWRITPSARYDRFTATGTYTAAPPADDFSHVSPKISIAFQATPDLSLYSNYGEAYRAPTINEMLSNTSVNGVYATTNFFNFAPNPTLKPETDTNFEIGANYNKAQVLSADDNLKLRATAFHTQAQDMITSAILGTYTRTGFGAIVLGPNGTIVQSQNVSSATRQGIELEGGYNLKQWQFNANFSRLRVTDNSTGANLFAPPDKLATQIRYAIPATDMSVLWKGTAVAAEDYDSTVLRRTSGYTVQDLYTSWAPHGQKYKVNFGIGNLFDKKYLNYQSGNSSAATSFAMGRNFMANLSGAF